jgi:hypothetical protein
MNTPKHTPKHKPEPWRVEYKHTGTYIFSNEPNCLLLSMSHTMSTRECNDNAMRIVSCINAMEGIEDPQKFVDDRGRVSKVAIDLLSALEYIVELEHPKSDAYRIAKDALEKAKL